MDADDLAIEIKERSARVAADQRAVAHEETAEAFLADAPDARRRSAPDVVAAGMPECDHDGRHLQLVRVAHFRDGIFSRLDDLRESHVARVVRAEHLAFRPLPVGEDDGHRLIAIRHMPGGQDQPVLLHDHARARARHLVADERHDGRHVFHHEPFHLCLHLLHLFHIEREGVWRSAGQEREERAEDAEGCSHAMGHSGGNAARRHGFV